MKIEYTINNITGKKKTLCIGDLIRYYGETKYKMIEGIQKLNESKTTRGMVANLLGKAINNPSANLIMNNLEELAKKNIFSFKVDGFDPLLFDNGENSCVIVLEFGEEYFVAKAIYAMMKPGFRKLEFEEYVRKEKEDWIKWFEKNLKKDYTTSYTSKILEK